MNINLTLVVQAVHFFIAYAIIKHLMLKPILKHMEQEESALTALHKKITHTENLIEQQEQIKLKQWRFLHTYFSNNTAQSMPPQERIQPIASPKIQAPTPEQITATTNAIATALQKAIIHE